MRPIGGQVKATAKAFMAKVLKAGARPRASRCAPIENRFVTPGNHECKKHNPRMFDIRQYIL
jgi:hypothetical protein